VFAHQQLASEVDFQGPLPHIQRHLAHRGIPRQEAAGGQRRVVVQHVDAAELRHRGPHDVPRRLLLREVAAERDCPRSRSPNLVGDLGGLRLVDVDDRDGGALAGQFVRRRRTDPARTPGDYRDLSGKSGHRVLLLGGAQKS
jgi:hypothetical protein